MTEPSLAEDTPTPSRPDGSGSPPEEPGVVAAGAAGAAGIADEGAGEADPIESDTSRFMRRLTDDAPAGDGDDDLDESGESDAAPVGSTTLLLLGLVWLGAMMWSAHVEMAGNLADATVVLSAAALALPGTVAASLLAGAAAGLAAVDRLGGASPTRRRPVLGIAAGAASGAVAAGVILLAYGTGSAVTALAVTVGVAGLLGGAAAATPPPALAAGVAATLGVFVTGVVLNLFQPQLTALFGAGDTVASRAGAYDLYVSTAAFVSGLVAGLIAYLFLRSRGPDLRWPAYLFAGAFAGLLAMLAEALTRIGGARLLSFVSDLSAADQGTLDYLGGARIKSALIVGFVGGIAAMIAFGRTLRRPDGPA